MRKNKAKYITQLDYIKVLLEEDRFGEALNYTNILSGNLNTECEIIAETFNNGNPIQITKDQMKTKPGNWMFIRDSWVRLIAKDSDTIHLEVSKNIEIKMPYNVVNENQPSTSK